MLYTSQNTSFKKHIHPTLKRRITTFLIIATVMLIIVIADIIQGTLNIGWALLSIAIGTVIGLFSTRIFNLTWDKDANHVIAKIDRIGWIVLIAYIVFEIIRTTLFQQWVPESATAITFAFVASALLSRVFGFRGKIIRILRKEHIL